jgi:hypothetical protein
MNPTAIAAFTSVAIPLIVLLPGPDWAFLLTAGTRQRLVLPAVPVWSSDICCSR